MNLLLVAIMAGACGSNTPPGGAGERDADADGDAARNHDQRFIGLWLVDQPGHALYEGTFYELLSDGTLSTGASTGTSTSAVTGSVANCLPDATQGWCESELTCIFGSQWHSVDASTLVIVADCSDDISRDIVVSFNDDASSDSEWGGAGAMLISVDSETNWSHNNFPWEFRRCPDGTDESTCCTVWMEDSLCSLFP